MEELYSSGENVHAKPNVRSFNSVLNAWAKSGQPDAANKAQDMLNRMELLYNQQIRSGSSLASAAATADIIRPDVHSFCTVINGTYTCGRFVKCASRA
jgi:hypothetical protein